MLHLEMLSHVNILYCNKGDLSNILSNVYIHMVVLNKMAKLSLWKK